VQKKKKSKSHVTHHRATRKPTEARRPQNLSRHKSEMGTERETYTPMETGQPDQDIVPGMGNPRAAQGGLGPLNQEGEGNRQNDELAELENIEPSDDMK
jgi:hypothetical protein